jgi:alkylated DNA repair dioxygenase AlkB
MFLQPSLFDTCTPAIASTAGVSRVHLDETSWIDHSPGWLDGADALFDELADLLPWHQRTGVAMYDQFVDEPRLVHWWSIATAQPEPLSVLGEMRALLSEQYARPFDSIGFNLYRDGRDSVAWHGDRHRHHVSDPVVAIVSVGARRPLRIRPRGGGPSSAWDLGRGDLFVMGGSCQHDWEHCVPKRRNAQPRLSITFRHGA